MQPSPTTTTRFRFAGWELRPAERQLMVADAAVSIGSRAFDLLSLLVARRGELVRKNELLAAVWPGLVVEENNISVQIASLRKWLGPDAIATVPGMGYRLSARPLDEPEPLKPSRRSDPLWNERAELIGRDDELQRLLDLLNAPQPSGLLTLVGPGGVGKTTLAREAMDRHAVLGGRDCYWIDLAPLRSASEWLPALAHALGVELGGGQAPVEGLLSALTRLLALVVLDNCEHLADAVASFLSRALVDTPGVRWLVTSQTPLHCPGELVERLAPLAVPPPGLSVGESLEFGSLALLCQRAAAADPRFRLEASGLEAAVQLCHTLDGLPLAIEMAAARVALLGLSEIGTQLGARLRLRARGTTGGRHATVRATLDWSYGLLTAQEQAVFRRLGVFVGDFRMGQAASVLHEADALVDHWAATEWVAGLIEKSLVQRSAGSDERFRLLETAREYALERAHEAGELPGLRLRHAEVMANDCDAASLDSEQLADADWAARYLPDRANVRAALAWGLEDPTTHPDVLARLIASFSVLDTLLYREAEIVRWRIAPERLAQATTAWRARARLEWSWAHYADGQREFGTRLAESACEDFLALGDPRGAYRALAQLVRLYESRPGMQAEAEHARQRLAGLHKPSLPLRLTLFGDLACGVLRRQDRSGDVLRHREDTAQASGFGVLAALCQVLISDVLLIEGQDEEVVKVTDRAASQCTPYPRLLAPLSHNRALALIRAGRIEPALAAARRALQAVPAHLPSIAAAACAAAQAGRQEASALLIGYVEARHAERAEGHDPAEAAMFAATLRDLSAALTAPQLDALRRQGASLSPAEMLAIARLTTARGDGATGEAGPVS